MLIEYPKISAPFKRADGTKKFILRQWINPTLEYLKDNRWIFTEKVDGTNIRIYWDGHRVSFHGRTNKAEIPTHLNSYLTETFLNNETEEMFEQVFGEKEAILFGEGYGPKIQCGGIYRDDVSFILFDVLVNRIWLNRENKEDIAKKFGLDIVPTIFNGTLGDAIRYVCSAPFSYVAQKRDCRMEGLVGVPVIPLLDSKGERIITKIKWCDFKDCVDEALTLTF